MIRVRANGEDDEVTAIFKNCTFENAGVEIKGMNDASEVDIQFINCTFTGSYYMYDAEGNKLTDKHGNVHYTSCPFTAQKAVPVSIDSRYKSGLNLVETGTNSYTMDGASVNYKGQ